ncbi:MAG: LPS export ABC transporter ATP-binding protein [Gammaproteobacteria bacterium]|nr:LPS export ABC transporter ATP-binding protein [Gammaproteobacteria bacterium]MDH5728560.1 LPS export ABC transporter ATP-binding protein [Gammaproteobacteria bacterium]
MSQVLEAVALAKSYKSRQVVKNVSLKLNSSEVVGLLGPNGAGKTTSFYMIVGLVRTDGGQILLDKQDITGLPLHARAQQGIGYLPQEASVFRKLNVRDNIMAVLEPRKNLSAEKKREKCEQLLSELSVSHLEGTLGMSLSGGERRRVEIARALAAEPKFILLDEPFAGVDPISVMDIQAIIQQLKSMGIGVLITDHNVRETLGICDRAYIINSGEVIAEGSPSHILEDNLVKEVYLGHDFRL